MIDIVGKGLKFCSASQIQRISDQLIITFRDTIHQLGIGKITPYLVSPERLTAVLAEIRDKLPEETKLIMTIARDTVHSTFGWIVARPTLADGQLRVFIQIPL